MLLEISDLIVDYDPVSLERRDVCQSAVVRRLRDNGQRRGARIAGALPARNDVLDADAVDAVLLRAHAEIQRLSEEFAQGERLRSVLQPMVETLWAAGIEQVRIVDVGCGLGYAVRWLAKHWNDPRIIWTGVDYNRALLDAADCLAAREGIDCEFIVGNAFRLAQPAHIFMSTGVVHHFREAELDAFFAQQRTDTAQAFVHFDIQPSWLSPVGAFIFHYARFQEPLGQHDGTCSAMRAHSAPRLQEAAADSTGAFNVAILDTHQSWLPIFRVMQAVIGLRHEHVAGFRERFALAPSRLGPFE